MNCRRKTCYNLAHGPPTTLAISVLQRYSSYESARDSFWENRDSADIIMGYRNPRVDSLARKLYSFLFKKYHQLLFGKTIIDPSCPYVLFNKDKFEKLRKYLNYTREGFWWGFVAGCTKIKLSFIELPVNHRVRLEGDTQVYDLNKIPSIAFRNALGLLKIRLMK